MDQNNNGQRLPHERANTSDPATTIIRLLAIITSNFQSGTYQLNIRPFNIRVICDPPSSSAILNLRQSERRDVLINEMPRFTWITRMTHFRSLLEQVETIFTISVRGISVRVTVILENTVTVGWRINMVNTSVLRINQDCRFCQSSESNCVIIPCGHVYCINCVYAFIESVRLHCPTCRSTIVVMDYLCPIGTQLEQPRVTTENCVLTIMRQILSAATGNFTPMNLLTTRDRLQVYLNCSISRYPYSLRITRSRREHFLRR